MPKLKLIIAILTGMALMASSTVLGQSGKVPPFRMMQNGGKVFRAQDLPVGKPIIIIYFSPDCEECQALTTELIRRAGEFSGASVAMVTYLPIEYVTSFISKYKLNYYPNIYVGTEGSSLFLKGYYNIEKFPLIALYTKNGDLVKIWKQEDSLNEVSVKLKAL
jgi:hypothetical protein